MKNGMIFGSAAVLLVAAGCTTYDETGTSATSEPTYRGPVASTPSYPPRTYPSNPASTPSYPPRTYPSNTATYPAPTQGAAGVGQSRAMSNSDISLANQVRQQL